MKNRKHLLAAIILLNTVITNAQVGIATNSPTSTLDVNGSFGTKITTVTVGTTLGTGDAIVLCNSNISFPVTLPSAIGIPGRIYTVKNTGVAAVSIETTSQQTIDGYPFYQLSSIRNSLQVASDGSNWVVLNSNGATPGAFTIGATYAGGKIAWVDGSGIHGLIAAAFDQATSVKWGCSGTTISGADGTSVGTGNQNTIDIVIGCAEAGTAARICSDLVLNGYSDWYLPSKDELNLLYTNRVAIGGFTGGDYWTSSEVNSTNAWYQYFGDGAQWNFGHKFFYNSYVRAVRSF
jgi:Protein of unknown function (DUF1566)